MNIRKLKNLNGLYWTNLFQEDLVRSDGYPLEKYLVTTKDGYINVMYRIPHGKDEGNDGRSRPAVLLNHGMTCSSATFIDQNPLAYFLVENGYDVWLPNNRGTTFSTKHAHYDSDEEKDRYWDFSFHEIAIYDLPAFIDFILEHTERKKISLIGFSQGVTTFAILASEKPEYNERINLSIFFGPSIVFDNIGYFHTKFMCRSSTIISQVLEKIFRIKVNEIPLIREMRYILSLAGKGTFCRKVMEFMFSMLVGHRDNVHLSELDFPRMGITTPNSSSQRQLLHFLQMIQSSRFAKYDYGSERNLKLYGEKIPPLYDLSKVTAPVGVFYAKNDMYNHCYKDKLEDLLGNVVHLQILNSESYNHLDFLYAKDNVDILYKDVLKLMNKYSE